MALSRLDAAKLLATTDARNAARIISTTAGYSGVKGSVVATRASSPVQSPPDAAAVAVGLRIATSTRVIAPAPPLRDVSIPSSSPASTPSIPTVSTSAAAASELAASNRAVIAGGGRFTWLNGRATPETSDQMFNRVAARFASAASRSAAVAVQMQREDARMYAAWGAGMKAANKAGAFFTPFGRSRTIRRH